MLLFDLNDGYIKLDNSTVSRISGGTVYKPFANISPKKCSFCPRMAETSKFRGLGRSLSENDKTKN
jgi:hypothetical protein